MYRPVDFNSPTIYDYNTFVVPNADNSSCTCKDDVGVIVNTAGAGSSEFVRCFVTWLYGVINYVVVMNPTSPTLWYVRQKY